MEHDDAKKGFKDSWQNRKEAAPDVVEGIKDEAKNATDEFKNYTDGDE